MEYVSSNWHWTNNQCRIIVPKHITTRIYWLPFILTACLKIFYKLSRDQQNMTGIKGKFKIHLAMIGCWRIRIFSIRFTLNKFLSFFNPNSIIGADLKIHLWMVSLSTHNAAICCREWFRCNIHCISWHYLKYNCRANILSEICPKH